VEGGVGERPAILTSARAEQRGVTRRELERAVRDGTLVKVRRDAYVDAARWASWDEAARHRARVVAAAERMPGTVFSHESAAALWRMPLIGRWPADVTATSRHLGGGRAHPGVRRRTTTATTPVALVDGLVATTPGRTALDLARTRTFACGLAAADHALRGRLTTAGELQAQARALGARRGALAARRVAENATADAESVGESLSRARMLELGLPRPELQVAIRDRAGLIGRVDFWWPAVRLVGEFDGRVKYRVDGIGDVRPLEERLWAEKRREDRLRAVVAGVVRWTWDDAWDIDRFAALLARAGLTPTTPA